LPALYNLVIVEKNYAGEIKARLPLHTKFVTLQVTGFVPSSAFYKPLVLFKCSAGEPLLMKVSTISIRKRSKKQENPA
jgi:hypothetical protein